MQQLNAYAASVEQQSTPQAGSLERLPKWLNLLPMVTQWLWLSAKYGAITLPSSAVTLTRASGSETMTASTFTSTPSGTGTLSSGTQNVTVGATLTVAAAQVAGVYSSGNFNVTVNYN